MAVIYRRRIQMRFLEWRTDLDWFRWSMMTSSNGDIFRPTAVCGEFYIKFEKYVATGGLFASIS